MNREFSTFVLRTLRANKDRYYGTDNTYLSSINIITKIGQVLVENISLYCVIVRVSVVLKRTVVGD